MKFYNHDISLLIKECEDFIYYIDEEEINNDCNTEEQIFINAISNMMLAYNLMANKKSKSNGKYKGVSSHEHKGKNLKPIER